MRVLITDPIHKAGIERLRRFAEVEIATELDKKDLIEKVPGFDVMIVRSGTLIDKDVLEEADELDLIVRAGVGLDNIDLETAEGKGVKVLNTPEAPRVAVAELTLGLMLAWSRNLSKADRTMKEGRWDKSDLIGTELWGKTLGIVGTGRVGRAVGRRAKAFGMDLLGHDIVKYPEFEEMGGRYVGLDVLLRESDYVTLHVQLNSSTKHMISNRELKLMKSSAVLVNTARGSIVDESALVEALNEGEIAGACIDVYEQEPLTDSSLPELPNVVLSPHLGASSKEAQRATSVLAARKVERKFEEGYLGSSSQ